MMKSYILLLALLVPSWCLGSIAVSSPDVSVDAGDDFSMPINLASATGSSINNVTGVTFAFNLVPLDGQTGGVSFPTPFFPTYVVPALPISSNGATDTEVASSAILISPLSIGTSEQTIVNVPIETDGSSSGQWELQLVAMNTASPQMSGYLVGGTTPGTFELGTLGTITIAAIPEPSSFLMLCFSTVALVGRNWFRRRKAILA